MADRADALRLPETLDAAGAAHLRTVAPTVWTRGLLTADTRADLEWLARVHSRLVFLRGRNDRPAVWESRQLTGVFFALSHRFGLTPLGAALMAERGEPYTLNPIPDHYDEPDEFDMDDPAPWRTTDFRTPEENADD